MKKKLLLTILAFSCSVCCAFGLAACGGGSNPPAGPDDEGGDGPTQQEPGPDSGTGTGGGGTSTASTEVNATQWQTALDTPTKFTLEATVDGAPYATVKIDGEKRENVNSFAGTQIFVKDGENYYQYASGDNGATWTKSPINAEYYGYTEQQAGMLKIFKDDYSSFTYASGKYTCASLDKSSSLEGTAENIEITFSDGALTGIKFDLPTTTADGTVNFKYEVSEIGTASSTVTLPATYTEIFEGQVSDNEWEKALSESAFTDFYASMTVTGYSEPMVLHANLSGDAKYHYTDGAGNEYCFSKEGTDYYRYFRMESAEDFTKTDETEEKFKEQFKTLEQMTLLNLADKKAQFAYDDNVGGYFGEDIVIGKTTCDVMLKFDGDKAVSMDIDFGGGELMSVEYHYGGVNIDLPQVYIDKTGNKELAGKKFVFSDVIGGGNYESAIKTTYANAYIEFGDDGTFTFYISAQIIHCGDYSLSGGVGYIHITQTSTSGNVTNGDGTNEISYENNKIMLKTSETRTLIFTLEK